MPRQALKWYGPPWVFKAGRHTGVFRDGDEWDGEELGGSTWDRYTEINASIGVLLAGQPREDDIPFHEILEVATSVDVWVLHWRVDGGWYHYRLGPRGVVDLTHTIPDPKA